MDGSKRYTNKRLDPDKIIIIVLICSFLFTPVVVASDDLASGSDLMYIPEGIVTPGFTYSISHPIGTSELPIETQTLIQPSNTPIPEIPTIATTQPPVTVENTPYITPTETIVNTPTIEPTIEPPYELRGSSSEFNLSTPTQEYESFSIPTLNESENLANPFSGSSGSPLVSDNETRPALYLASPSPNATESDSIGSSLPTLSLDNPDNISSYSSSPISEELMYGLPDPWLNTSNWLGADGSHYWEITQPGIYDFDIDSVGNIFTTLSLFAINILTSDVVVHGNNATINGASGAGSVGIFANQSTNIYIDSFIVQDKDFGVLFNNIGYNTSMLVPNKIENVVADLNNNGIYVKNSNNVTVSSSSATNNQNAGITLYNTSYSTVSGNLNIVNNSIGIQSVSSDFNTITGNNIQNSTGTGIVFTDSRNSTLSNTNVLSSLQNGVTITNGVNISLSQNLIADNTLAGVAISGSEKTNISGNQIKRNLGNGISQSLGGNSSLFSNTVSNNQGNGISLSGSHGDNITSNTIENNGANGILLSGITQSILSGNQVNYNGGAGLSLASTTLSNLLSN